MSEKVRITIEVPKTLVEYVDNVCIKKSTEIMKWNRSSYLRKLIIEDRDGKKELRWDLPKENKVSNKDNYDDLLDLSGYKGR